MAKTDRIPSKVAARIIGVLPQYLHQEMAAGNMDIGFVVKGKKRNNYIILRAKLEKFIGRKITDDDLM